MVLRVFIEFFGVKIAVGLSKNRCDLFLTVGFDFGSNLTVGSSYIRYKSFWTVRSSSRFKINRWIINIAVGFLKKHGTNLHRWIKAGIKSEWPGFCRQNGRYIADLSAINWNSRRFFADFSRSQRASQRVSTTADLSTDFSSGSDFSAKNRR